MYVRRRPTPKSKVMTMTFKSRNRKPQSIPRGKFVAETLGISRNKAEEYQRLCGDIHRLYSDLVRDIGFLFQEEPEPMYASYLDRARRTLDRFEREAENFINNPAVRTVSRRTKAPYEAFLFPRVKRYSRRRRLSKKISDTMIRLGVNEVNPEMVSEYVNHFAFPNFVKRQKRVRYHLRRILDKLDEMFVDGGAGAIRLYLNGVASYFKELASLLKKENFPDDPVNILFYSFTAPKIYGGLMQRFLLSPLAQPYVNLGQMGAVELCKMLQEEDKTFQRSAKDRALQFVKPFEVTHQIQNLLGAGINTSTVTTLIASLPVGRRNYSLSMLSRNPNYVAAFESLRGHLTPDEYMRFLLDYADIPIEVDKKQTSIFDVVNETVARNPENAALLVKDPSICTYDSFNLILQKLQKVPEKAEDQPIEDWQYAEIETRPKERTRWIDLMFPEYHPLRPLIENTYQSLAQVNGEHRLKRVPEYKLEEFCRQVQELPPPLLIHLVRDNALFDAYVARLGDDRLLERIYTIALEGGNSHKDLWNALKPPVEKNGHTLMSLTERALSKVSNRASIEQDLESKRYETIAVWGSLKPVQRQRIESSVYTTELKFVDPSENAGTLPNADAILFMSRVGVSHSRYFADKDTYRRRGTHTWHLYRERGVGSIVRAIQSMQAA